MSGIMFDYPLALLGLMVFIPIIIRDYYSPREKYKRTILPKHLRLRLGASRIFFRIFLACIIVAMAGPRWGMGQTANEYRRLLDVVIAIDVSRSMEIRDEHNGELSRLERGMAIVAEAVTAMPETRFAAAISRNRGIVAVPLTWDSGAILAFLEAAGSSLTGRGTNLESLVDAAAGAFQPSHHRRVILLVSDGEALSGSLRAAVERCRRDDIIVTAIAVGSDEGAPVIGQEEIISCRDPAAMQMAAGQTGGLYIDGNNEDAARALTSHLRSLGIESKTGGARKEPQARWFIFTLLAIITFAASKISLLGRQKQ
ncbi:MAG: VWA domain-containing protein [Treponema sp.]|nr:VWA domain-containing protein [Treponema sp.]